MSLISFGTNINAQRKRVRWYNRESSAETIYEGQPVCYMFDTTTNILNYDKAAGGDQEDQSSPSTTAEGYQNEGKFMIVEKPETDNLLWLAGVVAGGSWCGKSIAATSYEWVDVFVPNGAIVPVRCDVDTTTGLTILAITADSQELGFIASNSRPVAIAEETETGLDGTAGITLAKLDPNMFLYNSASGTALDLGTGATFTDQYVTSAITTQFLPFQVRSVLTGTGAGGLIGAKYTTENAGTACVGDVYGLWSQAANISGGAISSAGKLVGIWAKTHTATDSGTIACDIWGIQVSMYNGVACSGTTAMMYFDEGTAVGETADYWFSTYNSGPTSSCAYTADTSGTNQAGSLKVFIAGAVGYIPVYDQSGVP